MTATLAPKRLAMWSGPRNISTALLRSFENRPDAFVVDEPLYAYYLLETGKEHPGRTEILAAQPNDWRDVIADLTGPVPQNRAVYYQKHMAHHLLADVDRALLDALGHAFLIREPARMIVSLDKVTPNPGLEDTGLPQQVELFERVEKSTGRKPPVLDSDDVLSDPPGKLQALCAAWEIPFDESMLSWPAGKRATDGVWAPHWYAAVERSTGFQPPRAVAVEIPERLHALHEACLPFYERLHAQRL